MGSTESNAAGPSAPHWPDVSTRLGLLIEGCCLLEADDGKGAPTGPNLETTRPWSSSPPEGSCVRGQVHPTHSLRCPIRLQQQHLQQITNSKTCGT